ncbi:MAG: hypothetical protein Q8N08_04375 [Methanobacteriaceae archaeon]|nr:hypothetical protein [Methanobacteriaceae archaeon]
MTGDEDSSGIDGAIMEKVNQKGIRITMDVPSVDKYGEKILKASRKLLIPKTAIPGVGHIATFQDTEGNIFLLMEEDMNAH